MEEYGEYEKWKNMVKPRDGRGWCGREVEEYGEDKGWKSKVNARNGRVW